MGGGLVGGCAIGPEWVAGGSVDGCGIGLEWLPVVPLAS